MDSDERHTDRLNDPKSGVKMDPSKTRPSCAARLDLPALPLDLEMQGGNPRDSDEVLQLQAAGQPARRYSKIGGVVGRGRFGEVFRGVAKASGEVVAIKVETKITPPPCLPPVLPSFLPPPPPSSLPNYCKSKADFFNSHTLAS